MSKFNSAGQPLSPGRQGSSSSGGYYLEENARPQGLASDRDGNVWIANCGSDSVMEFINGNSDTRVTISGVGVKRPFDVAITSNGTAWVTSNGNDGAFAFDTNGNLVASVTDGAGGIVLPMGVASDSLGNVWVANSGLLSAPCQGVTIQAVIDAITDVTQNFEFASVTMIGSDGLPSAGSPYKGGGLQIPWGIAVDGNDNVWVANFGGQRLSEICGARPETCPPGVTTGDAISPDTGYTSDALVRNTGVQIDPSGNVWLANNWKTIPVQENPGGYQMVVFIGLAEPVKTPLLGAPRSLE